MNATATKPECTLRIMPVLREAEPEDMCGVLLITAKGPAVWKPSYVIQTPKVTFVIELTKPLCGRVWATVIPN